MGRPVNAFDAPIAGITLSNKAATIVTRDKDFLEIAKVADIEVRLI